MKKVIFEKDDQRLIYFDNVNDRRIVGFERNNMKGVIAWDETRGTYTAITLVNPFPENDQMCPHVSMAVSVDAIHLSHFLMKAILRKGDHVDFFLFDNMSEFFDWVSE